MKQCCNGPHACMHAVMSLNCDRRRGDGAKLDLMGSSDKPRLCSSWFRESLFVFDRDPDVTATVLPCSRPMGRPCTINRLIQLT